MSEDNNLKNLVSALTKFLAWQDELDLIPPVEDQDKAAYLMRVLGIDKSNVNVLIGGSNCSIFHKAASEIERQRHEIDLLRAQRRLAVDVLHEIRAGVNLGYSDVAMQRIDALIEDLSR